MPPRCPASNWALQAAGRSANGPTEATYGGGGPVPGTQVGGHDFEVARYDVLRSPFWFSAAPSWPAPPRPTVKSTFPLHGWFWNGMPSASGSANARSPRSISSPPAIPRPIPSAAETATASREEGRTRAGYVPPSSSADHHRGGVGRLLRGLARQEERRDQAEPDQDGRDDEHVAEGLAHVLQTLGDQRVDRRLDDLELGEDLLQLRRVVSRALDGEGRAHDPLVLVVGVGQQHREQRSSDRGRDLLGDVHQ